MTSDSVSPAKRRKITPSSKTNNTSITSSNSRRAGPYGGSSKVRARRSIWNAPDDWDELVAASNLSTSSVSTRRPPLREVPSLAKAAEDVAVRAFRLLWADGKTPAEAVNPESRTGAGKGKRKVSGERDASRDEGQMQKGWWELQWPHVPDHLKARVRDGVIRMHGGALSMDVIRKLFLFPPEYLLPGHLLPALSSAKSSSKTSTGLRTIPLHPHPAYCKQMTTLKIQHCPQYSDAAFADMVRMMPQLQTVNLKGCTLVGEQTVKAVIKLEGLRRVNLKGTRVTEGDVRELLGKKGGGLVGFKVDNVVFKDPSSVFTDAYPLLTHLCLPGTIINGPRNTSSDPREKMYNQTIAAVAPRATPLDATFTWSAFGRFFPALTHLYLPGLLIPPSDTIDLAENDTLVKLSLGIGGPQVPAAIVFGLLEKHARSLRKLHIGHLGGCDAEALGEVLANLEVLEDFRLIRDSQARVSAGCEAVMKSAGTWMPAPMARHWAGRLKYLHLDLGNHIPCEVFFNAIHPQGQSEDQVHGIDPADTVLESLSLSNTPISGPLPDYIAMPVGDAATEDPARPHHTVKPYHAVRLFPLLRSLDLSNTDITTEEVYDILDMCPLLTRVDLTSCRGVDVRMRRRIFAGWAESRGVRGS